MNVKGRRRRKGTGEGVNGQRRGGGEGMKEAVTFAGP